MNRPKILIIAMTNSVHTARWIEQTSNQEWDIYLFSSFQTDLIHPKIKNITVYHTLYRSPPQSDPSVDSRGMWLYNPFLAKLSAIPPFNLFFTLYQRYILAKYKTDLHAQYLSKVIQTIKPDLIHVIELQRAGYLLLDALKLQPMELPKVMITNYGSDIYLFSRLKDHRSKIKRLLEIADYYACECHRDVKLAQMLGFNGKTLPIIPNAGGFDIEQIAHKYDYEPTSQRRLILLKGYQTFAGRSLSGLQAIKKCKNIIKSLGYRVGIYSATSDVKIAAEIIAQDTGLDIEVYDPLSHEELLKIFGQARVYLGLSISDAISTSLLEAMVMKTFPIQSGTSCADEWLIDGDTGIIINDPEDVDEIALALQRALTNNMLVDKAIEKNYQVAQERLDINKIQPIAINMYKEILENYLS